MEKQEEEEDVRDVVVSRETSLTVNLQDGSDSPSELLRLLGQRGRSPRVFLVPSRGHSSFNISGAAK